LFLLWSRAGHSRAAAGAAQNVPNDERYSGIRTPCTIKKKRTQGRLTMDFRLSEDQAAARAMAIDFARREVAPHWRRREAEGVFHRDLIEKMGAAGMFGCLFPEEYGGNGMGFVAQVLVMEEMMRSSIESGMPFNNQGVNVPMAIYRHGTQAQKRRYVPELVAGRTIGCFGLTEPGGGSDAAATATSSTGASCGSRSARWPT
jgi:alkylation response protein AidB-like acyl-CoA dehydrogenase